jgi:hypothetical protein
MVDDENIKTTVSPFAIREGEIKKFDGKDGYVSISQIIHKINLGHINDIHFEILDLVNEFEFMTSRQIYFMLLEKGVDIKSQDKLNVKLEQLVKAKILTRYFFTSEEGKGIYRVYCLEKMGKYLLTSKEVECRWQPTDNTKPVAMMKKRLAGNQVIIAYMRKAKNFSSYRVKPQITAKMAGKTIKTHAEVKISKANKSISLLFEVVRRELGWEEKFVDRMRLFKDFYDNFVPFDSGFEIMPQLILVCEDEKHMVETLKQMVSSNLEFDKVKIYFTTDLKQNSTTLDKSFIEFVKDADTGKFKANNVEIKLLG